MSRTIWAVERAGRKDSWGVSSIHYTRAAARRQRTRDTDAGLEARVRKYVPFDQVQKYDKTLRTLESRVDAALLKYETPEETAAAIATATTASPAPRAGTLAGTTF